MQRTTHRGLMATALGLVLTVFPGGVLPAQGVEPLKPAKTDRCVECGMFVASYRRWTTQIVMSGERKYFDGCKCLFRYIFGEEDTEALKPEALFVTDYRRGRWVDGRVALYVLGSDVRGPMGRDLVPFEKEEDAKAFVAQHGGEVLRYDGLTRERLAPLLKKR